MNSPTVPPPAQSAECNTASLARRRGDLQIRRLIHELSETAGRAGPEPSRDHDRSARRRAEQHARPALYGHPVTGDVRALLEAAGAVRAQIVSISMGGMITQEFAIRHPERLQSLVLIATYAAPDAWSRQMFAVRHMVLDALGQQAHLKLATLFLFAPPGFRAMAHEIAAMEQAPDLDTQRIVAAGSFIHANPSDPIHYGEGTVTVFDSTVHLGTDFEVGPGPAFHAYLVPLEEITPSNDVAATMSSI